MKTTKNLDKRVEVFLFDPAFCLPKKGEIKAYQNKLFQGLEKKY